MTALSARGPLELVVLISAGLGGLAVIGKYLRKAFRAVDQAIKGVEYVKAQMERNGGSTYADAIVRIETATTEMSGQLVDLSQRVAVVEANTEIHARRLDDGSQRIKAVISSLDSLAVDMARLTGSPLPPPNPQEAP